MNKNLKRVLQGIAFVLIIIAFIFIGTRDFSKRVIVDNERFDNEYKNVNKDNIFTYVNAQDVYAKLKNGSSIIFMGYPDNEWTGYYANILNEAAKELGIKEIFYYDFKEDRNNKNATYQSIVLRLSNYNVTLDDGTQNIYAPTLVVVKDGKTFAYDNETAVNTGNLTPEDYWTELKTGLKLNNLKSMLSYYLSN